MRLEELKKGFWGYRKEPVFQYLTQIEDACARKLREREEQMEALRRQSQERIQALEQELLADTLLMLSPLVSGLLE